MHRRGFGLPPTNRRVGLKCVMDAGTSPQIWEDTSTLVVAWRGTHGRSTGATGPLPAGLVWSVLGFLHVGMAFASMPATQWPWLIDGVMVSFASLWLAVLFFYAVGAVAAARAETGRLATIPALTRSVQQRIGKYFLMRHRQIFGLVSDESKMAVLAIDTHPARLVANRQRLHAGRKPDESLIGVRLSSDLVMCGPSTATAVAPPVLLPDWGQFLLLILFMLLILSLLIYSRSTMGIFMWLISSSCLLHGFSLDRDRRQLGKVTLYWVRGATGDSENGSRIEDAWNFVHGDSSWRWTPTDLAEVQLESADEIVRYSVITYPTVEGHGFDS